MNKYVFWFLIVLIIIIICLLFFFFTGKKALADNIKWGVNFSPKQANDLGLDPKETYLSIIEDLKVDNIKIAIHWDLIESEQNIFNTTDFDFYIKEAEKNNVNVILAIGMKTPRWPEYHIPVWATDLNKEEQQKEILEMLTFVVERYKDCPNLIAWQVENEPFFNFGKAPWKDIEFLKKEIDLVKDLDANHSVIITDSGEMSLWFRAANLGDIIGITMYTRVWSKPLRNNFDYLLPPVFYGKKADIIKSFFDKDIWCLELQAEPWGRELIQDSVLEEQMKSMNLERLKHNIEYAKNTGLDTFYFWGVEWWYYMKEKHNDSSFLNEVKNLWN